MPSEPSHALSLDLKTQPRANPSHATLYTTAMPEPPHVRKIYTAHVQAMPVSDYTS